MSLKKINLYRPNTPFEEESWFLAGMMHEDDLFSYVYRIQKILAYAFIFSLIVGILGGFYFLVIDLQSQIVKLSKSVRENRRDEKTEY